MSQWRRFGRFPGGASVSVLSGSSVNERQASNALVFRGSVCSRVRLAHAFGLLTSQMLKEVIKYDCIGLHVSIVLLFIPFDAPFSTFSSAIPPATAARSHPASMYLSICSNNIWPLNKRHFHCTWWILGLQLTFHVINDVGSFLNWDQAFEQACEHRHAASHCSSLLGLCYADWGWANKSNFVFLTVIKGQW